MTDQTAKPARSWKTTAAGVGTILAALGAALTALGDGDPATTVEWGLLLPALATGAGLIFGRDFDVSSEGTKVAKKLQDAAAPHRGLDGKGG